VPQKDSGVSVALAQMFGRTLGQIQIVLTEEIRKVLVLGGVAVNHPNESFLAPSARWLSLNCSIAGPHRSTFAAISIGGTARNGDTRDSTTDITPRVSPLPERESYEFLRQSSRTSAENFAVTPPEQALRDLVSAAQPIATTGNSIEVLSLLKPQFDP
jgi:hypothetical protein